METNINANPWNTAASDDIERFAFEECIKRQRIDHRVAAMVYPAGHLAMCGRFATLGAQVTALDLPAKKSDVQGRILASGLGDQISFATGSLQDLPEQLPGQPFDIIVVRRGISNMGYGDAKQVIRELLSRLRIGGKLYLSLLGIYSEFAEGYADIDQPLDQRLCPVSPTLVKKYNIHDEVCLYSERDLFMLLLQSGASVLRTMTTTYGNVKGIAVRV